MVFHLGAVNITLTVTKYKHNAIHKHTVLFVRDKQCDNITTIYLIQIGTKTLIVSNLGGVLHQMPPYGQSHTSLKLPAGVFLVISTLQFVTDTKTKEAPPTRPTHKTK